MQRLHIGEKLPGDFGLNVAHGSALWHCFLGFRDAEEEAFKASCEEELLHVGAVLSCAVCLAATSITLIDHGEEVSLGSGVFYTGDSRLVTYASWMSVAVVSAVFCIMATLRITFGLFRRVPWEECIVFLSSTCLICIVCSNRWHCPVLFDEDPDDIWSSDPRQSPTRMLLLLDVAMTAVCLYLPIRTSVVWVLPVSSIGAFSLLQLFLPPAYPGWNYDTCFLVVLAAFALHGTHKNEKQRRDRWTAVRKAQSAEEMADTLQKQHTLQLDEIAILKDEIEATSSEIMDVVVPLPGALPLSGGAGTKCHGATSSPCRTPSSHSTCSSNGTGSWGSAEEALQVTEGDAADHDMDGVWELVTKRRNVATWLHHLEISGDWVVAGDGNCTVMRTKANGGKYLEGGRMELCGNKLRRQGKKTLLTYQRAKVHASRCFRSNSAERSGERFGDVIPIAPSTPAQPKGTEADRAASEDGLATNTEDLALVEQTATDLDGSMPSALQGEVCVVPATIDLSRDATEGHQQRGDGARTG